MKNYTLEVQTLFLSFILSDANLYVRIQNIYNPNNFDKSLRGPAKFIQDHTNDYSTLPDRAQIAAMFGLQLQQIDEINSGHVEWFLNEFELFTKHEELKRAILKAADLLEKSDFGPIEKMVKDAVQISLTRDLGTDYFSDPRARLNRLKENNGQCSTGWKSLDEKLYGGFNKREITIFCAGSGVGKSIVLQNLACNWMLAGLNGIYITCELNEELTAMRIDSMFTGISSRDIFKKMDDLELNLGIIGKKSGKLRIKYIPPQSPVNAIRAYIKELQIQCGFQADFLCTDYLDLLMPSLEKVSSSDLFVKDKLVSEELRALGHEFNLLNSSASQLNRGSVEEVEFDHSSIAGGISKIMTADNVIGIYRSRAMTERKQIQFQLMKTRSSSGVGSKIDLHFDTDCLRVTDLEEDEIPAITTGTDIMSRIKAKSTVTNTEVGKVEVKSNRLKEMLADLRAKNNG